MDNQELKKKNRKYSFTEYDPSWALEFQKLKDFLMLIWKTALSIEHIGSTSIPGMSAKSIIDVLVTVEKMENFKKERHHMLDLGFICLENYIEPNSLNFFQTGLGDEKINNIHICELGSQRQQRFIIMRDYFRMHPEKAKEYSDLKTKNRNMYPDDYVSYREAKKAFLDEIEQEAYIWHRNRKNT